METDTTAAGRRHLPPSTGVLVIAAVAGWVALVTLTRPVKTHDGLGWVLLEAAAGALAGALAGFIVLAVFPNGP